MKIKVKIKEYVKVVKEKTININDPRLEVKDIIPYCNFDQLVTLTKSKIPYTRIAALEKILRKYNYKRSLKIVRSLLDDPSVGVREYLTAWNYQDSDIVDKFFKDRSYKVRHSMLVSMHIFGREDVLNKYLPKLIKDRSINVRTLAKELYNKDLA